MDSPVHRQLGNCCFMLAYKIFHELWVLIYDAVEIKSIVIDFKLKQPCSLSTWRSKRKALNLNGFTIKVNRLSKVPSLRTASVSCELQCIHNYFKLICCQVALIIITYYCPNCIVQLLDHSS